MRTIRESSRRLAYLSPVILVWLAASVRPTRLVGQSRWELSASVSRTRAFGGAGRGFTVAVGVPLAVYRDWLAGGVGMQYWHARTEIVSFPNDPFGRRVSGVGPILELRQAPWKGGPRFYQAASAQLTTSQIPDRYQSGIERDSAPTTPREDFIGTHHGLGWAAELGVRQPLIEDLALTVAASAVHQRLFPSAPRWVTHLQLGLQLTFPPPGGQPPNPELEPPGARTAERLERRLAPTRPRRKNCACVAPNEAARGSIPAR